MNLDNKNIQLQTLALQQFSAFEEAEFDFCSGINVLIGANSTGKSHVMKSAYSLLRVCEKAHQDKIESKEQLADEIRDKLFGVFKPDTIGRLKRRSVGRGSGSIEMLYNDKKLLTTVTSQNSVSVNYQKLPAPSSSVYLPPHEFLSIYEGFISAYTRRETSFDETYFDLSIALNALPLRGPRLEQIGNLLSPIEKAIGGKVSLENGRFYIRLPEGKFEAPLVAEGYRKLAGLMFLIANGSITQNGILFWDEPEANLNPQLIMAVVDVLRVLANSGVQVFIATHDYLLSQELSLLAEYGSDTAVRFFSLHKPNKRSGVLVETGDSLVEIEHNPILDEFAAHYDRESRLFRSEK